MFEEKYDIDTTSLTRRGNNKSIDPQQHYKMLYNFFCFLLFLFILSLYILSLYSILFILSLYLSS